MLKKHGGPNKSSDQKQTSSPEGGTQPVSRSHELQYLLPNDALDQTLDYLTPEELARARLVNRSWDTFFKTLNEPMYQTASRFRRMRKGLPKGSLAHRLMDANALGSELLTEHCQTIFGRDLVLEALHPSLMPPLEDAAGPPATPLVQYFRDTQVALSFFMEAPDRVLPLFYGGFEVKTSERTQASNRISGLNPKPHWDALIEKAQAVRVPETKALFKQSGVDCFNGSKTPHYALLIDFLEAAIAFEGFLADMVLANNVATVFRRNQRILGGRDHEGPMLGIIDGESVLAKWRPIREQLMSQVSALLVNYSHAARNTATVLSIFANFRYIYHFIPMLLQEARFTEAFKQLSAETLFFLMRDANRPLNNNASEFANNFHWYVKENIPLDTFINPLSKEAIFWLLKQRPINTLLLKSPAVVNKLTDTELLEVMGIPSFHTHFNECIQNPRLLARLTPEFCVEMFKKNRRLEGKLLATPALIKEFEADILCNLLINSYHEKLFILAQHYRASFDKFNLFHFTSLVKKFSFRDDEPECKKALALVRYQLFYCLYSERLEPYHLPPKSPDLAWFEYLENQALLAQAYQAFEQQRVEEEKAEMPPTVGIIFEEPKVTLRIILSEKPAQKLPEPLVASWHSSVNEQTPLLPPPRARGAHPPQALLSVLGKTGLGLGGAYTLAGGLGTLAAHQSVLGISAGFAPYALLLGVCLLVMLGVWLKRDSDLAQPLPPLPRREVGIPPFTYPTTPDQYHNRAPTPGLDASVSLGRGSEEFKASSY